MDEALKNFVSVWQAFDLTDTPYALPSDLEVLKPAEPNTIYSDFKSYDEYIGEGLEHPDDHKLHLGLIPQPWFGDLASAKVFILLLNPGVNPGDYFGEYEVPAYKEALIGNLQSAPKREFPFLFFDPLFSWHPGARYFRSRLHWLVLALKQQRKISYREALMLVAREICCVQLVPYHSAVFNLPRRKLDILPSVAMSKSFVKNYLLPRADDKDFLIIVARQSAQWNLPKGKHQNVIQYEGSETRAAHLSPKSRGGQALVKHFGLIDGNL